MITAKDMAVLAEKNVVPFEKRVKNKIEQIEDNIQTLSGLGKRDTTELVKRDIAEYVTQHFNSAGFKTLVTKGSSEICYLDISW